MRKESVGPDVLHQMGYEPRDADLKSVLNSVFALFAFFLVTMGITVLLYSIFVPNWAKLNDREPLPPGRRLPPNPQLQTAPRRDMELYRQAEDKTLAGQNGAMSVEQAIDAVAEQKGIAGIRGTAIKERGTAYPGALSAGGATRTDTERSEAGATPVTGADIRNQV